MAESEPGTEVEAVREAAAEREAPAAVRGEPAPGLALAGARVAALSGAATLPSGRGGAGPALARQVLALQRAAGNSATASILARQPKTADATRYRVVPPGGSALDIATWTAQRVHAVPGRDVVGVLTAGQLLLFSADASPKLLDAVKRGPDDSYHLFSGVWWYAVIAEPDGRIFSYLFTEGVPRHDGWTGPLLGQAPEGLVADADKPKLTALVPNPPGQFFVAIPDPSTTTDDKSTKDAPGPPAPEPGPGPKWAEDQVRKVQTVLDSTKDKDKGPRPDKLIPWPRKDGKWFVNVWHKGDVRSLELDPKEDQKKLEERIRKATKEIQDYQDPASHVRVQDGATGKPQIDQKRDRAELVIPPGLDIDPTGGLPYTDPAFPARILSHGPEGLSGNEDYESTVMGSTVTFTMDLDYASLSNTLLGQLGSMFMIIAFRWELFDVSKLKLEQIKGALGKPDADIRADIAQLRDKLKGDLSDPDKATAEAELARLQDEVTKRAKEPDSGLTRNMARDVANMWDDTKADMSSPAVFVPGFAVLVAVSDVVQLLGAPISAFFSLLTTPRTDKSIGFSDEGLFLLRCFAQPVVTKDDVKRIKAHGGEPVIRPPSVAYLPVKVTPIHKRAEEANNAEQTALDQLRAQLDAPPPPFDREDVEQRIKVAEAAMEDNNVEAIDRAINRNKEQLAQIAAWRKAERENVALESRDSGLRAWKAMLDISRTSFADYEQRLNDDIEKLNKTRSRVATFGLQGTKGRAFRPRVTFVSEVDGRVYPLVCHLVEDAKSDEDEKVWRLVDTSSDETKETYTGTGKTHNAAIIDAFDTFKRKCDYGRGAIAIRLPLTQLKAATHEDIVVPGLIYAAPGFGKRFIQRLKDLATAAEITAMFVGGPLGVGIGIVGGVAGAVVAIHDLAVRSAKGQSLLSFEGGMDLLAVVGAVAMMGGAAARIKNIAKLSSRAKWVGDKLHVIGVGLMRGQIIVIPAALYMQIASIDKQEQAELDAAEKAGTTAHVDRAKYRARRLEALAQAIKSGIVTVRMAQMAENPELGWNPMKGKPGTTVRPPPNPDAPMNALTAKLKELATLLKKKGANNADRTQVIEALRTPHEKPSGPFEGYVPTSVLAENQAAVRSVRNRVKAANPDVIVGMERGGSFLADVLSAGDPTLGPKIKKIMPIKATPKVEGQKPKTKFAPEMADSFAALADAGAKKIAIVDYYMGGTTASELSALLRRRFASDPKYAGVTVEIFWIRESFGYEGTSAGGTTLEPLRGTPGEKQQGASQFKQSAENVTLALGDDMNVVLNPGSKSPINVFDDAGNIVRTVEPTGTQTTRDVMIDLINGPAP